ncbi:sigma-70 family RNA polymerase sigma factor [Salinibacillus xinjiangensis]|uniref:Sigma-70 family RNA polymerase sigma factor n=1 Tax=Salinibacillus xinjiangensis TaxID=1229268 RepID=A0A6G1X729_9BACI|nr:sigma-70 family RNA polymerase sigma factor [Salinibacillus xinjiangensis]MRG86811.1 sigma-70 family RNA polymerase sigma factor [Salinibacillus xinjiangensis]
MSAGQSLDEIYQSYVHDVYRYLLSLSRDTYLAEDLVQETFFRAYLHIEELHEENLKPWLFRVAHNTFIDHHRKNKRNIVKDKQFFQQIKGKASTEHEALQNLEIWEITNLLNNLSEKQRHAVLLTDFHDLSYQDAATIMKISISHFKVVLFRGRQALRGLKERKDQT